MHYEWVPDSISAFAVGLLQIYLWRINSYVSLHMDDRTRSWGQKKKTFNKLLIICFHPLDKCTVIKMFSEVFNQNLSSPEENHWIVQRAHCHIWVVIVVDIQTPWDRISKTSHIKVPAIQHLMGWRTLSFIHAISFSHSLLLILTFNISLQSLISKANLPEQVLSQFQILSLYR